MRLVIMASLIGVLLSSYAGAAVVERGTRPWPNAIVPYRIEPVLLERAGAKGKDCAGWPSWRVTTQAYRVCKAMHTWQLATGVQFVPDRKGAVRALQIKDSANRTTATLGYSVVNWVNVEPRSSLGAVLHEFGHVLGLMHEHQRPDRDTYLALTPFLAQTLQGCNLLEATCQDVQLNFSKQSAVQVSSAYDPCSLMHYLVNQSPRYPKDERWVRVFNLTDAGQARFDQCVTPFKAIEPRCAKIGQKCMFSTDDADVVRRFHGLPAHPLRPVTP